MAKRGRPRKIIEEKSKGTQRVKELQEKGYFVKVHGGLIIATGPGGRLEEKYEE